MPSLRGLILFALACLVLCGATAALVINISTARPPDLEALWSYEREPSFTLTDNQGDVIAIRGDFHGEAIEVADLPPHLVQAFIAIEDQRFYSHGGVDYWGLLRATLANLHAGRTVQGGSTITQQVAKNLFLTNQRTMSRKLTEILHAWWLERHLTKDEILKLYLNRIYLGAGTFGVDAAAEYYFGHAAREVTLPEAAILASLPKAPSRFAPTADLDKARGRAKLVLANMRRMGFITKDEEKEAVANPASPVSRPDRDGTGHVLDTIVSRAQKLIGTPRMDVVVETTLDMGLQALAQEAVARIMDAEGETAKAGEAALVVFDRSGALRALVGGRSYARSQFNRATQARRQPGSSFKPFVYLAALENGYGIKDAVYDEPVKVGDWTPENYGGLYRGRITVREAFAKSVNSVAVTLSETVGRDKVVEAANRMGIAQDLPDHRSIALGTVEMTLHDLTAAYLPFARNGLSADPRLILRIRTRDGQVLYEHPEASIERVITRRTAEDMTHLFYQVVHGGTGTQASLGDRAAVGKTGTSQESRDAWFIGYTGQLLAGVWVGNDDSTPMNKITGGTIPARIWQSFMAPAHQGLPMASLPGGYPAVPDGVDREELRIFLTQLKTRLDRIRHERFDRYSARTGSRDENRGQDRYDWRSNRDRDLQPSERQGRGWWPF